MIAPPLRKSKYRPLFHAWSPDRHYLRAVHHISGSRDTSLVRLAKSKPAGLRRGLPGVTDLTSFPRVTDLTSE